MGTVCTTIVVLKTDVGENHIRLETSEPLTKQKAFDLALHKARNSKDYIYLPFDDDKIDYHVSVFVDIPNLPSDVVQVSWEQALEIATNEREQGLFIAYLPFGRYLAVDNTADRSFINTSDDLNELFEWLRV